MSCPSGSTGWSELDLGALKEVGALAKDVLEGFNLYLAKGRQEKGVEAVQGDRRSSFWIRGALKKVVESAYK